jgi:TolB-like protein
MRAATFVLVVLAASGCASYPTHPDETSRGVDLIATNQRAADRLYRGLADTRLAPAPLLVAGFADTSDLGRPSALGRLITEHMASHLHQVGVPTVLLPLTLPLFVERVPGEHVVAPEVKAIASARGLERLVLGTYAVAGEIVYVSARIVQVDNSRILATHDYTLPLTPDVAHLLAQP